MGRKIKKFFLKLFGRAEYELQSVSFQGEHVLEVYPSVWNGSMPCTCIYCTSSYEDQDEEILQTGVFPLAFLG